MFWNGKDQLQVEHAKICSTGQMRIIGEERAGLGLGSRIVFSCNICNFTTIQLTEKPTSSGSKLNLGAVWGTLSTGSTCMHFTCMDVPAISYRKFSETAVRLSSA